MGSNNCKQCDIYQKNNSDEFCCLSCRDSMGAVHGFECTSQAPASDKAEYINVIF